MRSSSTPSASSRARSSSVIRRPAWAALQAVLLLDQFVDAVVQFGVVHACQPATVGPVHRPVTSGGRCPAALTWVHVRQGRAAVPRRPCGSLLRPPALLAARAAHAAGEIDVTALRAAEDEAIRAAVAMQERVGLQAATDGEFRRTSWHMDFIHRLGGIEKTDERIEVRMHGAAGDTAFTSAGIAVRSRVRLDEPIFADDFLFLQQTVTTAVPKLTIPSPSMVHYRGGTAAVDRSVYPDVEEFWADLSAAYADEVRALGDLGCRYLQLDDTSLAYLNDPAQRAAMAARGEDAEHQHLRYIAQINAALAGRPEGMRVTTHMCRGNYRSSWAAEGGYDFVAEALFGGAGGRRVLLRVRRRALRGLRAAAVRAAGQAGGARARHDQARRAGGRGRAQAAHRRGGEVRASRPAVPVAAVRVLLDGRGQRADRTTSRSRSWS